MGTTVTYGNRGLGFDSSCLQFVNETPSASFMYCCPLTPSNSQCIPPYFIQSGMNVYPCTLSKVGCIPFNIIPSSIDTLQHHPKLNGYPCAVSKARCIPFKIIPSSMYTLVHYPKFDVYPSTSSKAQWTPFASSKVQLWINSSK